MIEALEQQVDNLLAKGYPADIRDHVARLEAPAAVEGPYPFVLAVSPQLVPLDEQIARVDGATCVLDAEDLARFAPIDEVAIPDAPVRLVLDLDTGAATRNVTPNDALRQIAAQGRSPLTIEEGIALVTQHPEAVARNAGFSLCGSRCGDRRVTALWISERRRKLGWCWAGNPHTWLGSASCAGRL